MKISEQALAEFMALYNAEFNEAIAKDEAAIMDRNLDMYEVRSNVVGVPSGSNMCRSCTALWQYDDRYLLDNRAADHRSSCGFPQTFRSERTSAATAARDSFLQGGRQRSLRKKRHCRISRKAPSDVDRHITA